MKKWLGILLSLALLAVLPAACADGLFSDKDLTPADPAAAVDLTLTESGVEITQPGTYRLSGTVANGSIRVALVQEGTVWLLLDNVSVHNESGAALTSTGAGKLILTLAEGSVNSLSQGEIAPIAEDNNAAVYVRDDLTINGSGALTITGAYLDGVNCRDSLRIMDGQITVNAVDDGLVGKDEVSVVGGVISITANEGDGIKSTNSEDVGRGFVAIAGGEITILTGGGASSVSQTEQDGWGRWGVEADSPSTQSQKGIKAETSLTVSGGTIGIDSVDDALHAVDITVSGGELALQSGDDGMHADNALTISGGAISVLRSYEGLEGADIVISGGHITVNASDDGLNGAGGTDDDGTSEGGWGRYGRDMFSSSSGTLTITGGRTIVNASGDGVDVNGSIAMSGGELYVRGPQSSGNGTLDYDGTFTQTGGTVVAVGASGMAQGVNAPSVPGMSARFSGSGTLAVLDASGTTLLSFDAEGGYDHVVVYSDLLTDGGSYTLRSGGMEQVITVSTQAADDGFGGGRGGGGRGGGRP